MKIFQFLFVTLLMGSMASTTYAQCNLSTSPPSVTIDCGTPVDISALGLSTTPALATTFDGSSIGPGWATSVTLIYSNPCGPSIDGTPAAWFGNVPLPRTLTTNGFDLSCGGQVCFDLDFAGDDACGACNHCEDPDLLDEGVYFQYSIDGGASWVDIFYFQSVNGYANSYYQWDTYCFMLPAAAWTTNTMFQWDQPAISSSVNDHWGIDNVVILPTDCNFWYDWDNIPGFPDSESQTVSPSDTTTYYITYTDGVTVCLDSVVVNVNPLVGQIVSVPNPIVCGDCGDLEFQILNGSNGAIVDNFDPGIDLTVWSDLQGATAAGAAGCGGVTGNGLYFNGATAERYAETVAIDATTCGYIDFCLFLGNTATGGAPCENVDAGEDIVLEYSINGGAAWLNIATYNQNLWDGANFFQCFSEVIPVAAQTPSSMFRWRQLTYNACAGCDNWALDDVSIACQPPTITYNWSSGTVSDSTIMNPQACPGGDELYIASMFNSVTGCSAIDSLLIPVSGCQCFFMDFQGSATCQPGGVIDINGSFMYTYSPTTGTIEVEATNTTGTYTQSFNLPFTDSVSFNYSITGIPYDGLPTTVVVYFSDSLSCTATINVASPILPTVTDITGGGTYCLGANVAPILVDVTGTGPWTILYTLNGTPATASGVSSPISLGTAAGVYVLTGVGDAVCTNGAVGTQTIVVNSLPIVEAGNNQAVCAGDLVTLNGSGAATYTWNNGVINGTAFPPPVGTTVYTVTGVDGNSCINTDNVSVQVTAYPVAPPASPTGEEHCTSGTLPLFVASGAGGTYTWYSDAAGTNVIGTGPSLAPLVIEGQTNYYVSESLNGCEGPLTMVGIVLINCEATIVMPNVFTPYSEGSGGQGINDLFHPVFIDGVVTMNTLILNRWGNVIYETDDIQINWDGKTQGGTDVEDGTYFWKLTYTDLNGDEFEMHGNVQVFR